MCHCHGHMREPHVVINTLLEAQHVYTAVCAIHPGRQSNHRTELCVERPTIHSSICSVCTSAVAGRKRHKTRNVTRLKYVVACERDVIWYLMKDVDVEGWWWVTGIKRDEHMGRRRRRRESRWR